MADTLKALRAERHITQKELADAVGMSRSAIGMYEQGQREPDIWTLAKIADYYGVSMDRLLGRPSGAG